MLEDNVQVQDADDIERESQTAVRLPSIKYIKSRGFFTRSYSSTAERKHKRARQRIARRNNR